MEQETKWVGLSPVRAETQEGLLLVGSWPGSSSPTGNPSTPRGRAGIGHPVPRDADRCLLGFSTVLCKSGV